jgi:hypothetical protein
MHGFPMLIVIAYFTHLNIGYANLTVSFPLFQFSGCIFY